MPKLRRDLYAWARNARTPWRLWLALACAGVAALATVATHQAVEAPGARTATVRTAIRVACRDDADRALVRGLALDVWSEHDGVDLPLDVVVAEAALATLDDAGVPWTLLVADIDAVARAEAERLAQPEAYKPSDFFGEFRDFEAIGARMHELAAEHPGRASIEAIGGSIEGRPLWALRIGGAHADDTPMLVNGAQHAREWIAAMVTSCVADRLVREYDRDPAIRAFVDTTELWIVPVVNPDGYQYSWSSDRYWRKNRRGSHGVDLNRNFSVAWGGSGSSKDKRSEIYRGEYAFSEPETIALRDLAHRERIAVHVDFHSYGQLLLYPWNHTPAPVADRDRLAAIGDRLASAIFAAHGTRYTLKSGAQLYPAAGTMTDWMYGQLGATSFTIELRPKGGSGFVLPPAQIRPTCDEGLAAVLALRAALP